MQAIACAGGLALWANAAAGYDEVVRLCVSLLNHASLTVCDAFASVLGATAAAAKNSPALLAVPVPLYASCLCSMVDNGACRCGHEAQGQQLLHMHKPSGFHACICLPCQQAFMIAADLI